MSAKELTALAKVCHKYGIQMLKMDNLEMQVDLSHTKPPKRPIETSAKGEATATSQTDEDIMYWSSGNIDG